MRRPIAISLSPNVEKDDVVLALKYLFSPIRWFDVGMTKRLEESISNRLGKGYVTLAVNSGRSALYLLLKSLGIKRGDEVLIQALTCVAVPNAVVWLDAVPVYVDIDATYNMDSLDLKRKISKKTKAVIVQHSFGTPANMDKIKKVLKNKKIYLIEDCAMALGASYKGKEVGSLSDAAFFSFGRDKVISGVFGGAVSTKNKTIANSFLQERDKIYFPSPFWTLQQLLHPLLFSVILPLYNFGYKKFTLGKILLFSFQTVGLLSKPVYNVEVRNERPSVFPAKLPGSLAGLALNQLDKLEYYNKHRNMMAIYYFNKLKQNVNIKLPVNKKGSIWLRYPIVVNNAVEVTNQAKLEGMLLGDWYKDVVYKTISLSAVGYRKGDCPKAEKHVGKMVNLPTYPTLDKKQIKSVADLIKRCIDTK
jgi:perosamine synthetase